MESRQESILTPGATEVVRRPSHSSPNSSVLSDSPFGATCSISPLEPDPRYFYRKQIVG